MAKSFVEIDRTRDFISSRGIMYQLRGKCLRQWGNLAIIFYKTALVGQDTHNWDKV